MKMNVGEGFGEKLKKDIGKRYLSSGQKLGGELNGDKVRLCIVDDHGKCSNFLTRVFYGRLEGKALVGSIRISNYALILLGVLLGFCIENIIATTITGSLSALIFPIIIIICEAVYFFMLKRISAENDGLLMKYLEESVIEDKDSKGRKKDT